MHVFVEGNNLPERFQCLSKLCENDASHLARPYFVIAETGFGTGLNFVVACHTWLRYCQTKAERKTSPKLYYFASEQYPLTAPAMRWVWEKYNPHPEISAELLTQYTNPRGLCQWLQLFNGQVNLCVSYGNSAQALNQLPSYPPATNPISSNQQCSSQPEYSKPQQNSSLTVDAWFLDGFAPRVNPAMWSQELMTGICALSDKNTTAATFSVARVVRDGLSAAGFTVRKTSGFGQKREMLVGKRINNDATTLADNPKQGLKNYPNIAPLPYYQRSKNSSFDDNNVAIIGAGISGCTVAYALAKRGWRVSIYDKASSICAEASGNPQVVIHQKATQHHSPLNDFHVLAVNYAQAQYKSLMHNLADAIEEIPILQLTEETEFTTAMLPPAYQESFPDILSSELPYQWLSCNEASVTAAVALSRSAYCFEQGFWINPVKLCETLVKHKNITVHLNSNVSSLKNIASNSGFPKRWALNINTNIQEYSHVVVADGQNQQRWAQTDFLPIKALRGQITSVPKIDALSNLRAIICGKGFVLPQHGQRHLMGATYTHNNTSPETANADDLENITLLRDNFNERIFSGTHAQSASTEYLLANAQGRAGFRSISPDYLPIIGAVPDEEGYKTRYQSLKKNARRQVDAVNPPYFDGLYISTAYGSRGFSCAWLGAELLASEMNDEPCPVPNSIRESVHPARFIIRKLKRGS